MMDKMQEDIRRMERDIEIFITRRLPVAAGKFAKQHFQDNFRKGGFVNGGLTPWPPAKRLSSGGKRADSQHGTLMSSRHQLQDSIGYTPGVARVTVFNDVIYAPVHNEGGTVHPRITPKMRRYAWAKYYELGGGGKGPQKGSKHSSKGKSGNETGEAVSKEAEKWKRLALTKKESLTINIPKRQFMGPSKELDDRLSAYIEKEIVRIINQ